MQELKFNTGLVTYNLNGVCEVQFNPTDSNFVERLYNAFESLDKMQDSYKAEVEKISDKREIFDISRKRDSEMRDLIDGIFGVQVCGAVFGSQNVYARADGLPLWCNLMLAVMDEIDSSFSREQKLMNPRIAKYTAKYHK